jgi:hypothetical protein
MAAVMSLSLPCGMVVDHAQHLLRRSSGSTQPSRPLVVLLGWWGAQLAHVAKYAQLFEVRRG